MMRLSIKGKEKLRKKIEELLETVPENLRIKLDKDLLEDLIFIKEKDKNGRTVKIIEWSGPFLSKIDLSEVSFDNVLWDLDVIYERVVDEDTEITDLSNTNAVIDFKKSYEYLSDGHVSIDHHNLANVDLSNSNGECIDTIYYTDLSNTNIKLQDLENMTIDSSNLSGIDLSDREVDYSLFIDSDSKYILDTDLSNTGLKIKKSEKSEFSPEIKEKLEILLELERISPRTELQVKEYYSLRQDKELSKYIKYKKNMENIGKLIKEGKLARCIVNGKRINTSEENEAIKSQKAKEYEEYQNDLFNRTVNSI